jgi:hypothetical protein
VRGVATDFNHGAAAGRALRWVLAAVLGAGCGVTAAAAQTPAEPQHPIQLELNKLEPLAQSGPGCRVYFVVTNPDSETIEQLNLDLIVFGTDGIIARRLAFDLGPLPGKKTAVRLFDMAGLPCDHVGKLLINDVIGCKIGNNGAAAAETPRTACLDRLAVSSRASAPLSK